MEQKRLGLALSGGGSRGLAHIGVLKVFEREGIPIDYISGTSLGGIIAGAYATGIPLSEIEEHALKLSHVKELVKLVDLKPPRKGVMEGERIKEFLEQLFPQGLQIEDTRIPLAINAVDLLTGREVTLTQGPLCPAIMATCAVPGIFPPVMIDGRPLVDGGVLNNLPIKQVVDLGAGFIIAVNAQIDPRDEDEIHQIPVKVGLPLPEYVMDLYWAGFLMVSRLAHLQLDQFPPDVYIYPRLPADINMFFGFRKAPEIIRAGEKAAESALPEIMQYLQT